MYAGSDRGGGGNFFGWLFGGGPSLAPTPYRPRGYVGNNGRYYTR
jgi:hypothetical protein